MLVHIFKEVVFINVVKLRLLIINISKVVRYKELVEGQKVEEAKPVEINGVEEQKVEKILNKIKIKGVVKYLV